MTPQNFNGCPVCISFDQHRKRCPFGRKSQELQDIIVAAGYSKDGGSPSTEGIAAVNRIARENSLPEWHDISSIPAYDALILAARRELATN